MKDKTAYKALESIAEHISLSRLAKSIGKDKSWLYHKMKNDIVNGVKYRFNVSEYAILAEQLHKLAEDIHRCAEKLDSVVQDANRTAGRYYTNDYESEKFKKYEPKESLFIVPKDVPVASNPFRFIQIW